MRPEMIDLHSHVLPGIDDGATELRESVEMCRRAAADGCRAIFATPHLRHPRYWNGERRRLEELHGELCAALEGDGIEVLLGGEIALHADSFDEICEWPGGELLTLAGGRWVLLELDWHGMGPNVFDVLHELEVRELRPVIAHPERVSWVARDFELATALVDRGAALQLTAASLLGAFGRRVQEISARFCEKDLVHFVASDAHDLSVRPPGLQEAFRLVENDYGHERAARLFIDHPRAVIEDRPLVPAPALEEEL